MISGIHANEPVEYHGMRLDLAQVAVIMVHGRGGGTESILPLRTHIKRDDVAFIAPQARDKSWYPHPFTTPRAQNDPGASDALQRITDMLQETQDAGVPLARTILLGFSQGAIIVLEYAARNPQRYGGVIALSGGLLGADADLTGYAGSLQGTPIFIGSSEGDTLIPVERVRRSASILQALGAQVALRIYEDDRHTMRGDQIDILREAIDLLAVD